MASGRHHNEVYAEMMNAWVEKLCLQYCDGCKFDNPSQRRHSRLMNTVEEAWNEFHDEVDQCIDSLQDITITSEIIGTPLHASWLNYIEELR